MQQPDLDLDRFLLCNYIIPMEGSAWKRIAHEHLGSRVNNFRVAARARASEEAAVYLHS
jgi:hypothetical protein